MMKPAYYWAQWTDDGLLKYDERFNNWGGFESEEEAIGYVESLSEYDVPTATYSLVLIQSYTFNKLTEIYK